MIIYNSPSLSLRGEKGNTTKAGLKDDDLVLSNTAFTLFSYQIKQGSNANKTARSSILDGLHGFSSPLLPSCLWKHT